MRRLWTWGVGLMLAAAPGLGACGADEASGDFLNTTGEGRDSFGPGATAGGGGSGGAADVPSSMGFDGGLNDDQLSMLPPEMELKADFELPQATEHFVFVANPDNGTVSVIDAESLAITTVETGERPTFLRTLQDTDDALVLNVGSNDATLIRMQDGEAKSTNVDVVDGANAIAIAPDDTHAVVYFNSGFTSGGASSGSFQDVTVIRLDGDAVTTVGMTVGFRPRDVFFSDDGKRAFVVTEDGISVLDFETIEREGSGIAQLIRLGSEAGESNLDVAVTPDGRYALARQDAASMVRLIDLDSTLIRWLDLADLVPIDDDDADAGVGVERVVQVTDLDLSPGGDYALAVVRTQSAVLRIPVPGGFDEPETVTSVVVEGELIGSATIAADQQHALLYTTAVAVERMTILPLGEDPEPRTVELRKTISAVATAPDGRTALIVHKKADGDPNQPGIDPDLAIDRSHGYSLLRIASGDVKLQVTPVATGAFTLVSGDKDDGFVFLLFNSDALNLRQVQMVGLRSFLVETVNLGSPPLSLGAVEQRERIFINQQHPDGRITFVDYNSGEVQTVTGFELNSRIRN